MIKHVSYIVRRKTELIQDDQVKYLSKEQIVQYFAKELLLLYLCIINQINDMYQQEKVRSSTIEPILDHRIDMVALAILFVGFFSCLIRSDFNFVAIFFCYFVWQQRKDGLSLRLIMACLILLFIFDLIFALTEFAVWTSVDQGNQVWQTIRPLHNFGIFCFIVINVFKIVLTVLVGKAISQTNKAVQTR